MASSKKEGVRKSTLFCREVVEIFTGKCSAADVWLCLPTAEASVFFSTGYKSQLSLRGLLTAGDWKDVFFHAAERLSSDLLLPLCSCLFRHSSATVPFCFCHSVWGVWRFQAAFFRRALSPFGYGWFWELLRTKGFWKENLMIIITIIIKMFLF